MKRIFSAILITLICISAFSQIDVPKGQYKIMTVSCSNENETFYENIAKGESKIIVDDLIIISMDGYCVDILRNEGESKIKEGKERIYRLHSSLDNKEKTVMISKVDDYLFKIWIMRDSGFSDIFGFSTKQKP